MPFACSPYLFLLLDNNCYLNYSSPTHSSSPFILFVYQYYFSITLSQASSIAFFHKKPNVLIIASEPEIQQIKNNFHSLINPEPFRQTYICLPEPFQDTSPASLDTKKVSTPNTYTDPDNSEDTSPTAYLLLDEERLLQFCQNNAIDGIIYSDNFPLDKTTQETITNTLLHCHLNNLPVIAKSIFVEHAFKKVEVDNFHHYQQLFYQVHTEGLFKQAFNRLYDFFIALTILVITLPITITTALILFFQSTSLRTIFYTQKRLGKNNTAFRLVKFRSMKVDTETEENPTWTSANDPRITLFGNFLRKTHIDELPQLINVLMGDMSLVGPRPERPYFAQKLTEQIPFYAQRHLVKPGITGWAQLRAPYAASIDDSHEKLKYDLFYVKHKSLFFDLFILVSTVESILNGAGSALIYS